MGNKRKYELALSVSHKKGKGKNVTVSFPLVDRAFALKQKEMASPQSHKKKKRVKTEESKDKAEEEVFVTSNVNLGKAIAHKVQEELFKEGILYKEKFTGVPRMYLMTNVTRDMLHTLQEDYLKYY